METLWLARGALVVIVALAAIADARTGKIPNWITLPGIALGFVLHGALEGASGLVVSFAAACACAIVPYVLFHRGAMGGGDVKLLAAAGALGGMRLGMEVQLVTFVLAAIYVMCRVAYHGRLAATLGSTAKVAFATLRRAPEEERAVDPELADTVRLGVPALVAALFCVLSHDLSFLFAWS